MAGAPNRSLESIQINENLEVYVVCPTNEFRSTVKLSDMQLLLDAVN
jgi:hypothetical protein